MPIHELTASYKHAVEALKLFAQLRGSDGDFKLSDEAAELIRVLTVRFIPAFEEQ